MNDKRLWKDHLSEISELRASLAAAVEVARRCEWAGSGSDGRDRWAACPVCKNAIFDEPRHKPDCKLAAVLDENAEAQP